MFSLRIRQASPSDGDCGTYIEFDGSSFTGSSGPSGGTSRVNVALGVGGGVGSGTLSNRAIIRGR